MKRISAVILFISFLSASEFNQLYKIPFLIQHYMAHKSRNSELDFLSYLNLHYTLSHEADNDEQQDSQLPFKGKTNPPVNYLPAKSSEIKKIYVPGKDKFSLFSNNLIPSLDPKDIFHPPRA